MNGPLPPGALDLLNQLRDVQEPAAPHWFPPAPGWWVLLLLIATGALWSLGRYLARPARLRRHTLAALAAWAGAQPEQVDPEGLAALTDLLRRYARASGRARANLGAAAFTEHLVTVSGAPVLSVLADGPYRPDGLAARDALRAAGEAYVRSRPC